MSLACAWLCSVSRVTEAGGHSGRRWWHFAIFWGGGGCHWLAKPRHASGQTDRPNLRTLWSSHMVVLLCMVATMTSSLSKRAWSVPCAGSLCASRSKALW